MHGFGHLIRIHNKIFFFTTSEKVSISADNNDILTLFLTQ